MKKITAALLGAGGRGNVYSRFAIAKPEELEMVAVAEPNKDRREKFCQEYHIPSDMAFETWEELLAKPKLADAMMVCTMDDMHTKPTVQALEKGYHVLLEKPMANTAEECMEIEKAATGNGLVLTVCHVLRYTPFYSKLKEMIEDNVIGNVLMLQQTEAVGYWHQAHSFVRGNWGNSDKTSPMILQKCCHDLDIISWLIDSNCTHISSFGSLTHFKKENAPEGSPDFCMDGCPAEDTCPYFAPRFYLDHPKAVVDGFTAAVTTDSSKEGILKALEKGPYGRCVYHCDNNVVDHQVVNVEYENSATANLVMTAFTNDCTRTLRIMGTKGEIFGDMDKDEIIVQIFGEKESKRVVVTQPTDDLHFHHGGGDYCIIRDFVKAVRENQSELNRTTARQSLQSHLMCFAAEESRISFKNLEL